MPSRNYGFTRVKLEWAHSIKCREAFSELDFCQITMCERVLIRKNQHFPRSDLFQHWLVRDTPRDTVVDLKNGNNLD